MFVLPVTGGVEVSRVSLQHRGAKNAEKAQRIQPRARRLKGGGSLKTELVWPARGPAADRGVRPTKRVFMHLVGVFRPSRQARMPAPQAKWTGREACPSPFSI